jgi:hypothetical protein
MQLALGFVGRWWVTRFVPYFNEILVKYNFVAAFISSLSRLAFRRTSSFAVHTFEGSQTLSCLVICPEATNGEEPVRQQPIS